MISSQLKSKDVFALLVSVLALDAYRARMDQKYNCVVGADARRVSDILQPNELTLWNQLSLDRAEATSKCTDSELDLVLSIAWSTKS